MNLHYHDILIYVLIFLLLSFHISLAVNNHDIKVIRSGVEAVSSDSVGLKLYADVQNNGTEDFDVEFLPVKCCLETGDMQDCNALDIVVGCTQNIRAGETKSMNLVAPLISPVDRRGYCTAMFYYNPTNKNRRFKKNIRINFNTASHKNYFRDLFVTTKSCNVDEDPLNDCKPVDCETYYNSKRPYYDIKTKRCVAVPECVPSKDDDLAGIIYDPVTNKCKNSAVKLDDINYVKEQTRDRQRKTKGIVIIKKRKPHGKSVKTRNETHNNQVLLEKQKSHEHASSWIAICNQSKNRMVPVLISIILIQCIFLSSLVYFMVKNCCCLRKKKLVSKFFNNRQDVSVTTPLIATSNIDTDTTDYQFVSESSNVEKKIKCYKACHDKVNKAKVSLSDDILSKCLHRRDWKSKPVKSEAVYEYKAITEEISDLHKVVDKSQLPEIHQTVKSKKSNENNVFIENEISKPAIEKRSTTKTSKSVKKEDNSGSKVKKTERTELNDSDIVLSEQEIKCHSYNFIDSNINSIRASQDTYNTAPFKTHSQQISNYQVMASEKGIATSASTEKGAQASFSYDSIDDYLSERGMSYLVGEDLTKYSISSYSNDTKRSGLSGASSKTSKNNIVKNVLSLLTRKKKHSPSSYPREQSRESLNLQLIHMSNASVYSSSNNDSDCMRTFKRLKDSRSTL